MAKKKPAAAAGSSNISKLLKELETPQKVESDAAKAAVLAKQELDDFLGLFVESDDFLRSAMNVEPFGASNIVGTQFAEKIADGKPTGELCLQILVHEKPPESLLGPSVIPKTWKGFPTDVITVPEPEFQAARVGSGIVGIRSLRAGTLGAVVKIAGQGDVGFVLSNQHVLAPGATSADIGLAIQTNNSARTTIGRLSGWTTFRNDGKNFVDGAIATTTSTLVDPFNGKFAVPPNPILTSELVQLARRPGGLLVTKIGMTTGQTFGRVLKTNHPVRVAGTGFQEQIVIQGSSGLFSAGGDSGSLVVEADSKRPIGLLFAGSGNVSYVNRIENVISTFNISDFADSPSDIKP